MTQLNYGEGKGGKGEGNKKKQQAANQSHVIAKQLRSCIQVAITGTKILLKGTFAIIFLLQTHIQ